MVTAQRHGPMEQPIVEHIEKGESKDTVSSPGQTGALLKENFKRTTYAVSGNTNGQMDEFTLVNGQETKCTGRGSSYGQMGESTQVITYMIERKDMEFFFGMMAGVMKATG